ncbi:TonB-dependent receptor [Sphingobium phenoxybenzoativorans]|uniref:TonB-dependent receptor n=1 Tax=Sphingobium phenoxybenzoativorans TaxID=1592790 RepID=UPI000B1CD56F|nr:TonB-dependent receptor [Sphingobium phenoxybenzoativorans]
MSVQFFRKSLISASGVMALATAFGGVAQAQTSETPAAAADDASGGGQIQDIIVTAERREASVQRTPIAISAVGGEALRSKQIVDIESLSTQVPNVTFGRNNGTTKVFIRGIGLDAISQGQDSRVAIYTDGIISARSQAALLGFYDVERIEVLAGPQGTLYGRNATAGAINIITTDPGDRLDGYGTLTVGNYGLIRTEGAVGGPLSDTVSARLAFQTSDRNGYGENISTGQDVDDERTRGVRAKVKIEPSSSLKIILEADYYKLDDHSGSFHYLAQQPGFTPPSIIRGFVKPDNVRDVAGTDPRQKMESYGGSATVSLDLGGTQLTSLTGYRRFKQFLAAPLDGTTGGYVSTNQREWAKQFTQELRLARSIGPVDILLGAYYFHEKNFGGSDVQLSPALFGGPVTPMLQGALNAGTQVTNAYAAFSQVTVNITDRLGIDLGLRYSKEKRSLAEYSQFDIANVFNPAMLFIPNPALATFQSQKASWNSTDPKATIHYQFADTVFGYATYSQGFKSGGFNFGYLQTAFAPEKIKDYEVGLKADLFDRKLRANIAGFWYDYTNLQVTVVEGIRTVTRNAAGARIYGLEGQFTALPVDDLQLKLNLSWLHSEYTKYISPDPSLPGQGPITLPDGTQAFDLRGNQLAYSPKYKIDGEIGYTIHTGAGDFTPRANVIWVDRIYFSQFNHPFVSQPSRTEVNLFLDYNSGDSGWSGGLFVRNLTNKTYGVAATAASDFIGGQVVGQLGAPRTYGLSVTKRF